MKLNCRALRSKVVVSPSLRRVWVEISDNDSEQSKLVATSPSLRRVWVEITGARHFGVVAAVTLLAEGVG